MLQYRPELQAEIEAAVERGLGALRISHRPIVSLKRGRAFAYEAAVQLGDSGFPGFSALALAAGACGRRQQLLRTVRDRMAAAIEWAPTQFLVVPLPARELLDEHLYHPDAPLSQVAARTVLALDANAPFEVLPALAERLAALRALGFRILLDRLTVRGRALDNLALIHADAVRLDWTTLQPLGQPSLPGLLLEQTLERLHRRALAVVVDGIDRLGQCATVAALGHDLVQGPLFGEPSPGFQAPEVPDQGGAQRERTGCG